LDPNFQAKLNLSKDHQMPLSICELHLYENISRNLYAVIALFYNIKDDETLQPLFFAAPGEVFMRRFELFFSRALKIAGFGRSAKLLQ